MGGGQTVLANERKIVPVCFVKKKNGGGITQVLFVVLSCLPLDNAYVFNPDPNSCLYKKVFARITELLLLPCLTFDNVHMGTKRKLKTSITHNQPCTEKERKPHQAKQKLYHYESMSQNISTVLIKY